VDNKNSHNKRLPSAQQTATRFAGR